MVLLRGKCQLCSPLAPVPPLFSPVLHFAHKTGCWGWMGGRGGGILLGNLIIASPFPLPLRWHLGGGAEERGRNWAIKLHFYLPKSGRRRRGKAMMYRPLATDRTGEGVLCMQQARCIGQPFFTAGRGTPLLLPNTNKSLSYTDGKKGTRPYISILGCA